MENFLDDFIKKADKNQAEDEIIYLDIDELEENPKNFYGLRDVDALAGLISVSKLIEPLTVIKKSDGKYKIISGHRRHAAIKKLVDEGNFDGKIPCIVKKLQKIVIEQENGEKIEFDEDAVEMLNLIASNRGQREERTVDEKLQEVKYLETFAKAIYNQKERKKRGRFRTFFAEEILNISKSQLQRINSIEKLTDKVKMAIENKKISETAAIEMATLTPEEQDLCLKDIMRGKISGTVFSIQNWKIIQSFADDSEDEKIDENLKHELQIIFRYSSRIFGEDEIDDEKTAQEWLDTAVQDFYKKLYEISRNIYCKEKNPDKAEKWKNRADLVKNLI